MHDAHVHDLCMYVPCMIHIYMYDSHFYDAHVLDADECMYTCMMHKSMMQGFFVTDQRTNQQADYRSSL